MATPNITILLRRVAASNNNTGIITYPLGKTADGLKTSYSQLLEQAERNAKSISSINGFKKKSIVLLHLDDLFDSITLFWSVILAGGVPCISTPFTNIPAQREKHIRHLHSLLENPICITRARLLPQFSGQTILTPYTIEEFPDLQLPPRATVTAIATDPESKAKPHVNGFQSQTSCLSSYLDDLALLMLTSGSTGNAKAVRLSHAQMITAVAAKCEVRAVPLGAPFLNWINFDHVACVTEIHLQAMYLGVDQIHVQASDIVSDPGLFLRLLSEHRVGKSFAPNFYLAQLRRYLNTEEGHALSAKLDLSSLHWLSSGGEPNVVETCEALAKIMAGYGAPDDVIVPGFGMTETCAGSIWNTNCPKYDILTSSQFASLGQCMPGIEMRVLVISSEGIPTAAPAGHSGFLEVRGPVVFRGYYNNPTATSEAISSEGWFRTGDQAMIDSAGNINLIGRSNDHININGVKYLPKELEAAIEDISIDGVTPDYTVCFSFRPPGSQTEQIGIVYLPSYSPYDVEARMSARKEIIKTTMLQTGSRPLVLPLDGTFLMKTTLGKLSRVKIRDSFGKGDFKALESFDNAQIQAYVASNIAQPQSENERVILQLLCETLEISIEDTGVGIGVETPIFDMGMTSIHLIQLKKTLQTFLSIPDIPISVIMTNSTVRSLSIALENLDKPKEYDPIVVLQADGDKTPIWLFHPGIGEVLVFLGLSKYLQGRPVYALRARGFEIGQTHFESIPEAVSIYHAAIKSKQPNGPYALAGYSFGTMLAFETSKVLQANDDQITFLGSFNLPPHIKDRMRQLDWSNCLLHLSYFLGLIGHDIDALADQLSNYSKEEALAEIAKLVDQDRMVELSLKLEALGNWADLSYGLQNMARDYEPSGRVPVMDIFVAEPLAIVAANKEEWKRLRLSKWSDFCESEPRFHDVDGEHYTMIGENHVLSFQKTFRKALEDRGL
jgi:acyl-CoA synthetase (AMP-forming)/AMP-acid ligase II/thioesterase domain-containing protein